jgi:beta-lactamase class A
LPTFRHTAGFAEVVVALPDGEFVVDVNGGEPMEAASLYKLGIMIEVYVQRETGMLSFDDGVVLEQGYFTRAKTSTDATSAQSSTSARCCTR